MCHKLSNALSCSLFCLVAALFELANGFASPKIKSFAFNSEAQEGHREQVFCSVFKGDAPIAFSWHKDGHPIKSGHGVTVQELNDFSCMLTINAVTSQDIGNYTCTARNSYGSDAFTAVLIVKASPVFINEPQDVSATEGSTTSLDCLTRGYPKPVTSWYHKTDNHVEESLANSVRPTTLDNGSLIFPNLQRSDAGSYRCYVSNGVGTSLDKTVSLSVHAAPKVTNMTPKLTVTSTHVAKLECRGIGDPPIDIVWYKGHQELRENDRYEIHERPTDDGVVSEMLVIDAVRSDAGIYKCKVRNQFGEDEKKMKLRVVETPESPKEVKVLDVWSRSVNFGWAQSYDGGSPLSHIIVQYWKDIDGSPHRLRESQVPPGESTFIQSGLSPGTQYALRLIAETEIGRGHPSGTLTFQTDEEAPTASPTDLIVTRKGTHSLSISWKAPPREHWNGGVKGYYTGIKVHGNNERFAFFTVANSAEESLPVHFIFQHLKPATRYSVIAKAYNGAGTGPASHELQAETRELGLPKPSHLYVSESTTNSLTFHWKKPHSSEEDRVSHYVIHLRQTGLHDWQEYTVPTNQEYFAAKDLEIGTKYLFYITAHGPGDISSDPTETLSVMTDGVTTKLNGRRSEHGAFVEQTLPQLVRLEVLIPVLSCLVIIVTVVVLACAYVARSKARYVAMADAQLLTGYETSARLSQSYRPMTPLNGIQTAPKRMEETGYDIPWDVPTLRA